MLGALRTRKTSGHNTRTGHLSVPVTESFTNNRHLQMQLVRGTNVRIGLKTIRQRLLEDNLHI
jgi:hypothetical protein